MQKLLAAFLLAVSAILLLSAAIYLVRVGSGLSPYEDLRARLLPPALPPAGEQQADEPPPPSGEGTPPLAGGAEKTHRRLELTDLVGLYPRAVFRSGRSDRPLVALTFDDGPDNRFTPRILDVLAAKEVDATFFVTGIRAERHPDLVRRMVREGHVVGDHGYAHARYSALSAAAIAADLKRNKVLLDRLAGSDRPPLFRPPYGALDALAAEAVIDRGYRIILWSIDSHDWLGLPRDAVVARVVPNLRPGAVILQHAAGGAGEDLTGTVEALPHIIDAIRERGLRPVTIPELFGGALNAPARPASQPRAGEG